MKKSQDGGLYAARKYYSWYVVAVLLVMNMFAWIDRQIIVLLIDPIRHDLGITEVQISLLTGFAFAILHATCGLPLGWLADRASRRLIIFWGIMGWSIATVACGFSRSFWHLFFGRVGVGVGEAALSPAAYSMLADIFPPKRLAFANSVLSLGVGFGLGLSFAVGGLVSSLVANGQLIETGIFGAMHPWQVAFLIVGAPGILVAFLAFTIKEPERTQSLSVTERSDTGSMLDYALKHIAFYSCMIMGMAVVGISLYAMMTWGPVYLSRVFGWGSAQVGSIYGGVMASGMVLSLLLGGKAVDYLYARGMKDAAPRLYAFGALVNIPITVLAVAIHNPWVFLTCLFFWLILAVATAPNCIAAMQNVTPNEFRARFISIYLFAVTFLGLGLGPLFVAMLTQYVFADDNMVGWSLAIVIVVVNPFAAILLWLASKFMRAMAV